MTSQDFKDHAALILTVCIANDMIERPENPATFHAAIVDLSAAFMTVLKDMKDSGGTLLRKIEENKYGRMLLADLDELEKQLPKD